IEQRKGGEPWLTSPVTVQLVNQTNQLCWGGELSRLPAAEERDRPAEGEEPRAPRPDRWGGRPCAAPSAALGSSPWPAGATRCADWCSRSHSARRPPRLPTPPEPGRSSPSSR